MPGLEGAKKGQWGYERKEGGRQEAGAANDALPHAAVSAGLDLVENQMELLGEGTVCESEGSNSRVLVNTDVFKLRARFVLLTSTRLIWPCL